jgi:hypothetical protein
VSYALTFVKDTNDALDQNTMSEQNGSEYGGTTLVGSESAPESDSDQSFGNTGLLPGEEDAPDDNAQNAIDAADAIAQSATENPQLYNHVISSGERAKADRERPVDAEEQSEGDSSYDDEDKQSEGSS